VTVVLLLHMHQALLAAAVPAAALLAGYAQLCTYGPRLQASLFNPPQVASWVCSTPTSFQTSLDGVSCLKEVRQSLLSRDQEART
jgi:hypothetical protein